MNRYLFIIIWTMHLWISKEAIVFDKSDKPEAWNLECLQETNVFLPGFFSSINSIKEFRTDQFDILNAFKSVWDCVATARETDFGSLHQLWVCPFWVILVAVTFAYIFIESRARVTEWLRVLCCGMFCHGVRTPTNACGCIFKYVDRKRLGCHTRGESKEPIACRQRRM